MVVRDDNGRHTARVLQRQDKQVVVRDGREGPEYDRVSGVTFSADGASLAYEAQRGREHLLVLDDREWPLTAQVVRDSLRVAPATSACPGGPAAGPMAGHGGRPPQPPL